MTDSVYNKPETNARYKTAELTWETDDIWCYLYLDVNESKTFPDGATLRRWVVRCVRRGTIYPVPPCSNCGGTSFKGIGIQGGSDGIICETCKLAHER